MKKKKKMGLFDKFYLVWSIVIFTLLIGCILWYFLVERPSNQVTEEIAFNFVETFRQ